MKNIKNNYLKGVLDKLNKILSDQIEAHPQASKGEITVKDAKDKLLKCLNEFTAKYKINDVDGNKYKLNGKTIDEMKGI